MDTKLEDGFEKANSRNIPTVSSDMIFDYILRLSQSGVKTINTNAIEDQFMVDFVQVQRNDVCVLKAILSTTDAIKYKVALVVDELAGTIMSVICEGCDKKGPCGHTVALLFWTHRKSSIDEGQCEIKYFWPDDELEVEGISTVRKVSDKFLLADNDVKNDNEELTKDEKVAFLEALLDHMEKGGKIETSFYQHFRNVTHELEQLYIHHIMLNVTENGIRDSNNFFLFMEELAKNGLFEKAQETSLNSYKTQHWMELQYCRIRCSLVHKIANRQDTSDDDDILKAIFCVDRERNTDDRIKLKQYKRYVMKQTEGLENKQYQQCGVLMSPSHPYICAMPDGITDDHIVEIKAPRTEEQMEEYLQMKRTVGPKYMSQLQIQMYLANVSKALYCVLCPTFETTGALHYVWVHSDIEFTFNLLSAAEEFWKDIVFNRIKKIYLKA